MGSTRTPKHAATSASGWIWLGVAAACFLGIALTVAGSFIFGVRAVRESAVELAINGATCRSAEAWSGGGTIFLRTPEPMPRADALAAITIRDAEGNILTAQPLENTTLEISSGSYVSVGTIELSGIPPDQEVCVETTGLDGTLSEGDLLFVGDFASPIVTALLSSCAVGVVLGVAGVLAIIRSRIAFAQA